MSIVDRARDKLVRRDVQYIRDDESGEMRTIVRERFAWNSRDTDPATHSGIEWWAWALAGVAFFVIFFGLPVLMTLSGFGGAVFGMIVWTIRMTAVFIAPIMLIVSLVRAVFVTHEYFWPKFWAVTWLVAIVLVVLTLGVS